MTENNTQPEGEPVYSLDDFAAKVQVFPVQNKQVVLLEDFQELVRLAKHNHGRMMEFLDLIGQQQDEHFMQLKHASLQATTAIMQDQINGVSVSNFEGFEEVFTKTFLLCLNLLDSDFDGSDPEQEDVPVETTKDNLLNELKLD